MRVLALANRKGGCGKTTLSTAVASAFAAGGVPAALVDLDPQGSATAWAECRPADRPKVRLIRSRPASLADDLRRLTSEGIVMAVLDTPPHSDAALAGAVAVADAVLCPSLPSAFDLLALASILPTLRQSGRPIGIVLTSVTHGTVGLRDAEAAIGSMDLPLVGSMGRRMVYQYAAAKGLGPTEMGRRHEAVAEVEAVCRWVMSTLEGR